MMGMVFSQMTPKERVITILVMGGIVFVSLIIDRIAKRKKIKNKRDL